MPSDPPAPLTGLYPATTCPDLLDFRAWSPLHKPTLKQAVDLRDALAEADPAELDWKACGELATRLGVEFTQVQTLRFMSFLGSSEP